MQLDQCGGYRYEAECNHERIGFRTIRKTDNMFGPEKYCGLPLIRTHGMPNFAIRHNGAAFGLKRPSQLVKRVDASKSSLVAGLT